LECAEYFFERQTLRSHAEPVGRQDKPRKFALHFFCPMEGRLN